MSSIGLPPPILDLFAPRPILSFVPQRGRRFYPCYNGLFAFIEKFEKNTPEPPPKFVSRFELKQIKLKEKMKENELKLKQAIKEYNPKYDPEQKKTSNSEKTLFVARLNYETTVKKLFSVFSVYGEIEDICIITDLEKKSRGFAFIEFKTLDGMYAAYRSANKKVIDGNVIFVDKERNRIEENWLPRRLGGGLGPGRIKIKKESKNVEMTETKHKSAINKYNHSDFDKSKVSKNHFRKYEDNNKYNQNYSYKNRHHNSYKKYNKY